MTATVLTLTFVVGIAGVFAKHPGDVSAAVRMAVALGAYTFGALLILQANEQLGQGLALLVLVALLLYYGQAIGSKLHFLEGGKTK